MLQASGPTVVAAVPGQPLPLGTVGGSDDADEVAALDGQVVLAALGGDGDRGLVHGLLLARDLLRQSTQNTKHRFFFLFLGEKNKHDCAFVQSFYLRTHRHTHARALL